MRKCTTYLFHFLQFDPFCPINTIFDLSSIKPPWSFWNRPKFHIYVPRIFRVSSRSNDINIKFGSIFNEFWSWYYEFCLTLKSWWSLNCLEETEPAAVSGMQWQRVKVGSLALTHQVLLAILLPVLPHIKLELLFWFYTVIKLCMVTMPQNDFAS